MVGVACLPILILLYYSHSDHAMAKPASACRVAIFASLVFTHQDSATRLSTRSSTPRGVNARSTTGFQSRGARQR
jgi:hypothetical protein